MAMVVKNNMSAVRTLNTLNANTSALQKSLQKVSSGMKINSAQDDASGYAISERMRVRIRSLDQANQNTQNDASLMKTAEGAVGNTVEILRALKEKAINAANDSNTDEDRQTIQKEINQFIDQIDDNALVQFNGKYLIDGSKNNATISSKTILLNQSLEAGTLESRALTDLRNRASDSLGIQTSDKWQVSYVQNGNIHFASGTVGDNSLEDILNLSWKTTDGNFGQVKATTDDGRISKGSPVVTELATFKQTPGTLPDELKPNVEASDQYAAALAEAKKAAETSGTGTGSTTVSFADLGLYADKNGTTAFTLADGSTKEAADVKFGIEVTYNKTTGEATTDYKPVEGLNDGPDGTGIKIYGVAVENINTADQYLKVDGVDPSTYSVDVKDKTVSDFKEGSIDADLLGKVPDSDLTGSAVRRTATASLKDVTTTDATGKAVPKYYVKGSDGSFTVADFVIKRQRDGSDLDTAAPTITSDTITLLQSDGSTAVTDTEIYEINPNYTTSGTGFEDAPDKFGKAVYTPDKTAGIAVASTGDGVDSQISGLTISILDQDGNVKKAANAALDQFKQYQRAENKTGDMSLNFHIGSEANVAIKVGMSDMRSQALGLKGSDGTRVDVYTKEHANAAINVIENALTKALDQQTTIGAIEARLEYTSTNLTTSSENVQAAESTIRDADMAKEMTNYTKSNVLLQAAQAMLAQANQNSSAVLSLLQ